MNARTLPYDRNAEAIVEEAKQGIRSDIAALKAQIESIAPDINRLRALLVQHTDWRCIEVNALACLSVETMTRLLDLHQTPVSNAHVLFETLKEADADPEWDEGGIEVICFSHKDLLNLGARIAAKDPCTAEAIIDASTFDSRRGRLRWDVGQFSSEAEAA